MRNNIGALYRDPRFKVEKGEEVSELKKQEFGIRQGCPLSPYLFILVMTVMFFDIHVNIDETLEGKKLRNFEESEILYADDTLLVLQEPEAMNELIKQIEIESSYYGLRLNKSKCNFLDLNGNNELKFQDGTNLEKAQSVTYLGGVMNQKSDSKE